MTGRDAFKIWAPAGARWVDWVRPVPFVAADDPPPHGAPEAVHTAAPNIACLAGARANVAVIVDAPGADGVRAGIALAKTGFRPIPLYNGTTGQKGAMALVDTHELGSALLWGAAELAKTVIVPHAPPAFLLDSSRTHRYRMDASVFDNSWDLYDQDMPSAEYLLRHGIDSIIVWGERIQNDLRRILFKFQKKGIAILFTNGYAPPKRTVVKKPVRQSD